MEKDSGYFWNIISLQGVLTVKKIKKEEGHKKGRHDWNRCQPPRWSVHYTCAMCSGTSGPPWALPSRREAEDSCRGRQTPRPRGFRMHKQLPVATCGSRKSGLFTEQPKGPIRGLWRESEITQWPRKGWQALIYQIPKTPTRKPSWD